MANKTVYLGAVWGKDGWGDSAWGRQMGMSL